MLVEPENSPPSARAPPLVYHWYVNGPVPLGVVLNEALVPGQLVRLVNAEAPMAVLTVSVALLVALPQVPVTSTV